MGHHEDAVLEHPGHSLWQPGVVEDLHALDPVGGMAEEPPSARDDLEIKHIDVGLVERLIPYAAPEYPGPEPDSLQPRRDALMML